LYVDTCNRDLSEFLALVPARIAAYLGDVETAMALDKRLVDLADDEKDLIL
jgi:hypothetical protein